MKKLKINTSSFKEGLLTREQLKMLMGGDKLGGDCQESGESCDTLHAKNCCNGLHCAEFKCYPAG